MLSRSAVRTAALERRTREEGRRKNASPASRAATEGVYSRCKSGRAYVRAAEYHVVCEHDR